MKPCPRRHNDSRDPGLRGTVRGNKVYFSVTIQIPQHRSTHVEHKNLTKKNYLLNNNNAQSASNCDHPPGGGTCEEVPPPGQPAGTNHPNPFYADHHWLPFHRCTMRRSFYNQREGSNSDAEFPLQGSSLQAFQHPTPHPWAAPTRGFTNSAQWPS